MDDFTRRLLNNGKSAQEARLTECPVCHKEVSTRAPACPHCGEPMKSSIEVAPGGAVTLAIDEEIKAILQRDGKIAAIKRVRELDPKADLVTAKQFVETIEATRSPSEKPTPSSSKNIPPATGCMLILILGAVAVGAAWLYNSENTSGGSSSSSNAAEPSLTLESHKMEYRNGGRYIVGTVTNNTGKKVGNAFIHFNLYDSSGAQVGDTLAGVSNLEAYGRWNFEAPVTESKTAKYTFQSLEGH